MLKNLSSFLITLIEGSQPSSILFIIDVFSFNFLASSSCVKFLLVLSFLINKWKFDLIACSNSSNFGIIFFTGFISITGISSPNFTHSLQTVRIALSIFVFLFAFLEPHSSHSGMVSP